MIIYFGFLSIISNFLKLRLNLNISLYKKLTIFSIFASLLKYLGIIFRLLFNEQFIDLSLLSLVENLRMLSLKKAHILLIQAVSFYFIIKLKLAYYDILLFFLSLGTTSSFVLAQLILIFLDFNLLSVFKKVLLLLSKLIKFLAGD